MKTFIAFVIMLYAFSLSAATSIDDCGEFRAFGEIVKNINQTGYSLLVNPQTKSEYQFRIKIQDELKISSFVSTRVEVSFLLTNKMNGMKGSIAKILDIKKNPIKDHLMNKKNEIEIIKKSDCIK